MKSLMKIRALRGMVISADISQPLSDSCTSTTACARISGTTAHGILLTTLRPNRHRLLRPRTEFLFTAWNDRLSSAVPDTSLLGPQSRTKNALEARKIHGLESLAR